MSIQATAAAAALTAFNAAGDAKTTVTLRLGPTTTYDAATDVQTPTWEQETAAVDAVGYSDVNERRSQGTEKRLRTFIMLGTAVTAATPTQSGEIVEGSITWKIYAVIPDPTESVWIFHCAA